MIGRTNAGGGGGGGLNFKIVGGTTEPSNPKENMIWINTDKKITSYIFDVIEPTSYAEGMVWITTGSSSDVAFNAMKKNSLQVYPLSAKQYISGEFVELTAMSYQSGKWVEWDANYYLFKSGKGEIVPLLYGALDGASYSVTNEAIIVSYSGNNNLSSSVRTENAIDLTEYTTLVVVANCTAITGEKYGGRIGISKTAWTVHDTLSHFSAYTTFVADNKVTEYTLDISTYKGEYYCGFHGDTKATVYDMFLL